MPQPGGNPIIPQIFQVSKQVYFKGLYGVGAEEEEGI